MRPAMVVLSANFSTMLMGWTAEQWWVESGVQGPALTPEVLQCFGIGGSDVSSPVLATWGLLERKSVIQDQTDTDGPP